MTAVYIHFPYCLHRCAYCDFATVATRRVPRRRYRDAVLRELERRTRDVAPGPISSVFFGGGTPSLWGAGHVGAVLDWLAERAGIEAGAEITLEANPGAAEAGDLDAYIDAGINRISVGVQAVDDARLKRLDRIHDAAGARATLAALADRLASGRLASASADLLLGGPDQGMAELRADLDVLLAYELPHLSIYALTVEAGTPLAAQVGRGLTSAPDDGLLAALPGLLEPRGLRRYEVSNHARPGHESRHNLAYWTGAHYLAAGVGAHGFVAAQGWIGRRYGNHRDARAWFADIDAGVSPEAFAEDIDAEAHLDERLLTGLRLAGGIDLAPARAWAGDGPIDALLARARAMAGVGVRVDDERVVVAADAMLGLDGLILELLR